MEIKVAKSFICLYLKIVVEFFQHLKFKINYHLLINSTQKNNKSQEYAAKYHMCVCVLTFHVEKSRKVN